MEMSCASSRMASCVLNSLICWGSVSTHLHFSILTSELNLNFLTEMKKELSKNKSLLIHSLDGLRCSSREFRSDIRSYDVISQVGNVGGEI